MAYKVLMIAPTPFFADRGCHVHIYEEVKHLQQLGHKVIVCTYHNGRDIDGVTTERIVNIPWYRKLEAGASWHKLYLDVLLLLKSYIVARRFRPDVIHGHLHEGCAIGYLLARACRRPLLFDYQGSLTREMQDHGFAGARGICGKIFAWFERRIDNLPAAILVHTNQMLEELTGRFAVPMERVIRSGDGVDTDVFHPAASQEGLRAHLGIPDDHKVVVYLGLLEEYQGVDVLLEAIPLVLRECPNTHFLIMGYPNVEKYTVQVRQLGVAEHVTFTGRIPYEQAPAYLCLGDVAVGPKISMTEGDGKLYDYMACGLPVVASDRPISRQILGPLGVYAQCGEPEDLARCVASLLTDDQLRRKLSKRVRDKCVTDYSWAAVAQRIQRVYKNLCVHSSRRANS